MRTFPHEFSHMLTPEGLRILKGHVISVHLKDKAAFGNAPVVVAGKGVVDVAACLEELKAQGTALAQGQLLRESTGPTGAAAASPLRMFGQSGSAPSLRAITDFLQTLARLDGGYAWGDQEISHLTPTFGVIGCYRVLKQTPPKKDGSRMSRMVRNPGLASITAAIELTVIDAVAMSPCTPPSIFE